MGSPEVSVAGRSGSVFGGNPKESSDSVSKKAIPSRMPIENCCGTDYVFTCEDDYLK